MMNPISEERQRKVLEWAYPILKGKAWQLESDPNWGLRTSYPERTPYGDGTRYVNLPRLYVKRDPTLRTLVDKGHNIEHGELVPNYQWFFTEAVAKLRSENVDIAFTDNGATYDKEWAFYHKHGATRTSADPIVALAEYVEAQGEAV